MKVNYNELEDHGRMLDGNINRMFITKNIDELEKMKTWAIWRIEKIYDLKRKELNIHIQEGG